MRAVEAALGAGEVVKFEGAPAGWPRLSRDAMSLYLVLAVPVLLATTAGPLTVPFGNRALDLPIFPILIPVIALIEFLRVASFRSTIYVVTDARILVLRGILRVRPRTIFERGFVEDVKLVDSEPALVLEGSRTFVFAGLPASDADAIRVALGRTPMNFPVTTKPRRNELAVGIFALVVFIAAHVLGVMGRNERDRFDGLMTKVGTAIANAEAQVIAAHPELGLTKLGRESNYRGNLVDQRSECEIEIADTNRRRADAPTQPLPVVDVWVEGTLPWGALFYGPPKTVVRVQTAALLNDEALAALKKEFERAGIDAKWPEGVK